MTDIELSFLIFERIVLGMESCPRTAKESNVEIGKLYKSIRAITSLSSNSLARNEFGKPQDILKILRVSRDFWFVEIDKLKEENGIALTDLSKYRDRVHAYTKDWNKSCMYLTDSIAGDSRKTIAFRYGKSMFTIEYHLSTIIREITLNMIKEMYLYRRPSIEHIRENKGIWLQLISDFKKREGVI